MATHKYIYWRPDIGPNEKGETLASIHLIVGNNRISIANLQRMANELRETFPRATDNEISGGKVFESSYVEGAAIVTWNEYIPKGDYPGWEQFDEGKMEYRW